MLRRRYQFLLIAALVLTVFYPSLFAEFNDVDDVEMVTNLLNTDDWSFKGVFLPGGRVGLYYRPLLYLTFLFDRFVWFLSSSFMHLENVLFHLANTFLVFFLASELLRKKDETPSYLPLVAALCFGLHPIVTEPVNWISGRTDVMAGTFVLLSAVALLRFKRGGDKKNFIVFFLSLVGGLLCKEVALAFIPGIFFILVAREDHREVMAGSSWSMTRKILLFAGAGAGSALLFFLLRFRAYTTNSSKIGLTLKFIANDTVHAVFVFLRAFGFYIKKLFWPFPLNFAIVDIDPLYEILAILIVFLCIYIASRRTLLSAAFIAGVFMITPAFPIAFNQIAWTPYAERYVYIASAFIVTVSVLFLGTRLSSRAFSIVGVPGLLVFMGGATVQRNLVWQTNLSLYSDTVKKSPTFDKVWNQLGIAYFNKRDLQNAEKYFAKASSFYNLFYDEQSDLNLALVLDMEGKKKEENDVYQRILSHGADKSARVIEQYLEFLGSKAAKERNSTTVVALKKEMLKYNEKLYAINGTPMALYRMGNILNSLGDSQEALAYYQKAYEKFPINDKYRRTIERQIAELTDK